jgi:16S rRNA (guanine966-N2)-methyltransferase
MLRIVAGRFRGRRLHCPPGLDVRPTADRVKESLYDILQSALPGASVLDLYSGTGNLGLEALSRGARRVVLVERAPAALAVLVRNLDTLGVRHEVEVVRGDALRYLARGDLQPFDIVFADPPYAAGAEDAVLRGACGAVLRPGGWLVLQHARSWRAPAAPDGFRQVRSKRFGDTVVDFFAREEAASGSPQSPDGPLSGHV